jgi:hypothetical protein
MSTGNKVFGIIAFLMILFVYLNEMKNITEFIIKYKSIKDIAKINMEQKCKNIYCEAETDRFQIAKNMYDLLLPNDIYNAKTYTVMVMIFSIMLFIYVLYTYISYINGLDEFDFSKGYGEKQFVLGIISIAIFIMILGNIILRYTPHDDAGYISYFVKKDNGDRRNTDYLNYTIFSLLGGFLIIYIVLKMFLVPKLEGYEKLEALFITLYFIFAFYFMYNMINIVEAFRTNNVPKDIYNTDENKGEGSNWHKYWSADIGYDSENYFYNTFFDIKEIPFAIFSSFKDDKQKYDINDIYIFRNLPIIGLALFIFIMILFVAYIITNNDVKEYILQFLPIVFLFFLVFAIVVFTTFNTAFNKYVLYGVCKSSYTRALNGLNNAVVPFIAMHEKDSGGVNNNLTDYRYNYIVLSVIISYFTNHVNLMTNTSNVTITPKTDKEDTKYNLDNTKIGKILSKFKDETFVKNNFIKLKPISDSDTTDLGKFEAYYKEIFKYILHHENIPSNLSEADIQSLYIDLLNKIFYNAATKPTDPKLSYNDFIQKKVDPITSKPSTTHETNKDDLINKIRNSVYYYINKLEIFNDNVNDAAHSVRTTFMKDFLFYVNDDNTIDPYKFIMIKGEIASNASFNTKYDTDYKDKIDKVIKAFLTHIRSLYTDVNDTTSGYSIKITDADKSSVFNSQIKTSLTMLSDTKGTESKTITRETTEDKLEYLFKSMKDFKIKVNAKTNYLVNVVETISNQLNNTDAKVKLYEVTPELSKFEIKATDKKLSEISNELITVSGDYNSTDAIDILHVANTTVQEIFTLAYATNIFVLGIVYLLIPKPQN